MSKLGSPSPFRPGPLSPTSPPNASAKPVQSNHGIGQAPQTPTSPPLMSVSAQNNASTIHPSSAETTSQQPLSSPPSSEPMSAQVSHKTILTTTNTFPTPASSTYGTMASMTGGDEIDGDGMYLKRSDTQDALLEPSIEQHRDVDSMDIDQEEQIRPNYDPRNGTRETGGASNRQTDGHSHRSPAILHHGSPAQKDVLELLHQDIGSAFLLCTSSHPAYGPDPTKDLISMYGLDRLAATVARTDPVTGEKINRLRKSYEGKLQNFGLAGKNKPVKHEEGKPGSLFDLMSIPEDQWQNQTNGKDAGLRSTDTESKFLRAMKMEPGRVRENNVWEEILGLKKPKSAPSPSDGTLRGANSNNVHQATVSNGAGSEASRPRRANRKRRYVDESFEGYGEGFNDEDNHVESLHSDEDSRPMGKKRRKKEAPFANSSLGERTGSYGVGMYAQ